MLIITFIDERKEVSEYECLEIEFGSDCIFADGMCIPCKNVIKVESEEAYMCSGVLIG